MHYRYGKFTLSAENSRFEEDEFVRIKLFFEGKDSDKKGITLLLKPEHLPREMEFSKYPKIIIRDLRKIHEDEIDWNQLQEFAECQYSRGMHDAKQIINSAPNYPMDKDAQKFISLVLKTIDKQIESDNPPIKNFTTDHLTPGLDAAKKIVIEEKMELVSYDKCVAILSCIIEAIDKEIEKS